MLRVWVRLRGQRGVDEQLLHAAAAIAAVAAAAVSASAVAAAALSAAAVSAAAIATAAVASASIDASTVAAAAIGAATVAAATGATAAVAAAATAITVAPTGRGGGRMCSRRLVGHGVPGRGFDCCCAVLHELGLVRRVDLCGRRRGCACDVDRRRRGDVLRGRSRVRGPRSASVLCVGGV